MSRKRRPDWKQKPINQTTKKQRINPAISQAPYHEVICREICKRIVSIVLILRSVANTGQACIAGKSHRIERIGDLQNKEYRKASVSSDLYGGQKSGTWHIASQHSMA
ncbi:MAG TPA: hypothetical protein PLQ35_17135 [bacterium]|nr:hypothetical protein [bacterium]HQL64003.1 hypothetical protein [bacterium]